MRTRKILKSIGESEKADAPRQNRKSAKYIRHGVLVILIAVGVYARIRAQIKMSVWIACMILLYLLVYYVGRLLARIIKQRNLFYRRDFLLIKQFSEILEKDKSFIFILAFASFLFISYNWIAVSGVLGTFPTGVTEGGMKIFTAISFFAYVVFLAISSGIIYFKCNMELEDILRYFRKLYLIGLTRNEFDSLIRYRLVGIFFIPCTLCTFVTSLFAVYIGIDLRFIFIIAFNYAFHLYGYRKTRKLYTETYSLPQ